MPRLTTDIVGQELGTLLVCSATAGELATSITDCRSTMPEEFDPYSQWLGILAHERPIDHYRLLGIARFSADPATIATAADRRMALIRSFQTGPRGRLTQPLLNEIAAAKLCLVNPPAKAAYDAMLEGLVAASEPPPAAAPPSPTSPPRAKASKRPETEIVIADQRDDVNAEAGAGTNKSARVSVGSALLVVALIAIVGVASYATWQGLAAPRPSPKPGPRLAAGSSQASDGAHGGGEGKASLPNDEPTVVFQETDGGVNFSPSVAVLHGASLQLESVGITDSLTGWTAADDSASWKCKIIKLPSNGVFRVLITYRASTEADEGSFQIALNDREKTCQIRGTGEFVTDEYFLAATRSGEQTMQLRSPQLRGGTFEVRSVRLVMPGEIVE